jgi:hypothetical protein
MAYLEMTPFLGGRVAMNGLEDCGLEFRCALHGTCAARVLQG